MQPHMGTAHLSWYFLQAASWAAFCPRMISIARLDGFGHSKEREVLAIECGAISASFLAYISIYASLDESRLLRQWIWCLRWPLWPHLPWFFDRICVRQRRCPLLLPDRKQGVIRKFCQIKGLTNSASSSLSSIRRLFLAFARFFRTFDGLGLGRLTVRSA